MILSAIKVFYLYLLMKKSPTKQPLHGPAVILVHSSKHVDICMHIPSPWPCPCRLIIWLLTHFVDVSQKEVYPAASGWMASVVGMKNIWGTVYRL